MLPLRLALISTFTFLVTACGGGGGGSTPATIDPAFTNLKQQLNGNVDTVALASDGSGDIYLGGGFTTYNNSSRSRIVRLNSNGSVDTGFAVGTGFNDAVHTIALASDGSGDVYVGGRFTSYNGSPSNYIIRLNSDGSVDTAFNVGTGFNTSIFSGVNILIPANDNSGDIYVGGRFTSYNGSASNYIIRLNSNGSIDTAFEVGSGFDSYVTTLATANDSSGDIYIGGNFTSYNGGASTRIIRLNSNGTVDATFAVGNGFDNDVTALASASDGSGDVYVVGNFTSYDSNSSNRIIRLNSNGTVDTAFAVGTGFGNNVYTIALAGDNSGDIYVGGGFSSYNDSTSYRIIRLNSDGSIDTVFAVNNEFSIIQTVNILAPARDGSSDVYVGSENYNKGWSSSQFTRVNNNGSVDTGFAVYNGLDNGVLTLAPASDGSGDVYVGGGFSSYGGNNSGNLIRLNSDGSIDSAFNVGDGFGNDVTTLLPTRDGSGDIYVGGAFDSYDGNASSHIIRLNSDGSIDTAFDVGSGFNNTVNVLISTTDGSGDIYVGGHFTSYDGNNSSYIIRLNSDGSVDTDFAVESGFNNYVTTLTPVTDGSGDIYVGGSFTSYNDSNSNYIIRLNSDGSIDTAFNVGSGFNTNVYALAMANDDSGDIYVGGGFSNYNGSDSNYVIRLNSDGSIDTAFDVGSGFNIPVWAITPAIDSSGDIYIGGGFTSYNGNNSNYIIRLNNDATVDTSFAVGNGFNRNIDTIALSTDGFGDIYVGGFFSSYQTTTASYIIALNPDGSID